MFTKIYIKHHLCVYFFPLIKQLSIISMIKRKYLAYQRIEIMREWEMNYASLFQLFMISSIMCALIKVHKHLITIAIFNLIKNAKIKLLHKKVKKIVLYEIILNGLINVYNMMKLKERWRASLSAFIILFFQFLLSSIMYRWLAMCIHTWM